jgi:hypothetical protein
MFPPEERLMEMLRADLAQQAVTVEGVKRDYGVSIEESMTSGNGAAKVVTHA